MKRRDFLVLVGGAALVDPRATAAQTPGRIYHLATIRPGVALTDDSPAGKILLKSLAQHGYVLGQNLTFEARAAIGDVAKFPALFQELKAHDVNAVLAVGYTVALGAKGTGMPTVVAWGAGDPVATKLIDSLARLRPEWQVVMVGPVVKIDPASLPRRSNSVPTCCCGRWCRTIFCPRSPIPVGPRKPHIFRKWPPCTRCCWDGSRPSCRVSRQPWSSRKFSA